MAASLTGVFDVQSFTDAGLPLVAGRLYTYVQGTTTQKNLYTDAAGTIPFTYTSDGVGGSYIALNARGELPSTAYFLSGGYDLTLKRADGSTVWTRQGVGSADASTAAVSALQTSLTASSGASLIGFIQAGTGATPRTEQDELRDRFSVKQFGAKGDSTTDDTASIAAAITALPARGSLKWPAANTSYKIQSTVNFVAKPGCVFDFSNVYIDASGFTSAQDALYFKGVSEAVIRNVFLIGNKTFVSAGMEFDADNTNITIHAQIDQLHVSGCNIAVKFGNSSTFQFSDNSVGHVYGSDSNIGIYCTGSNTLAMWYAHLEAYNNAQYGVLFEQGNGTVGYLQGAKNPINFFFGKVSGLNHNLLNRWDILGGYSEMGNAGEVWIGSTACADTNPFHETVTVRNFRATPFSSTNVRDFVQWNLNGDLLLEDVTITSGTQGPQFAIACNNTYRKGSIKIRRGVWDMNPPGGTVPPITYSLTHPGQVVDIEDVRCNNTLTVWQNAGAVNPGTMIRGIDTRKVREFESALLAIPGLASAWSMRDLPSGTCRNLVPSGPDLAISASAQQYDFWQDDGLGGFLRYGSNSSKFISASSASKFAVGPLTFGAILRCTTSGVDETNYTSLGDAINSSSGNGLRVGIGNTGTAFVKCSIGTVTASAVPDNAYDPHLVIGTYTPSTSLILYAINLRTGNVVTTTNTTSIPATGGLSWANSIWMRNDSVVRGSPFVYTGAITAAQAQSLQQAALRLVDSWRLA